MTKCRIHLSLFFLLNSSLVSEKTGEIVDNK